LANTCGSSGELGTMCSSDIACITRSILSIMSGTGATNIE
jgi:hypothetical protein